MVDREQEQARLVTATTEPGQTDRREVVWITIGVVALAALAIVADVGGRYLAAVDDLSPAATSALLAVVVALPLGAALYAVRRYREADEARAALHHLSFHDPLTGLPNRRFLGTGFDEMLRHARRHNGRVGVFFVDLDGFKRVNDLYGHEAGDHLMVVLAERLTAAIGPDDVALRYGGDEFVVLCPGMTNTTSAERVARQLLKAIEAPLDHHGQELAVSASIGIALSEERCTRPDEVLKDADAAMYQAKNAGPGRWALFDRGAREQLTPSTAERRLREALERGEFRLYYQPIVSLWTKRLVGAEALLRWKDPARGMISPGEFMPVLESSGLIVPIGDWIIEEVCRQSRAWQDDHPDRPPLNIKLNVSARQLAQANFHQTLTTALETTGADPDRLCLEFTAGALMFDVTTAWATLREVKALGVSLALDDFGTGYSSLSYLRQFSIDLLTVDKSFVDGIGVSREDVTIIEHVIGLAKALGIVTVAEGVETEAQVEALRSLSCDLAQGYWFSHPQPPTVISQLLDADVSRHEWRPPSKDEAEAEDTAAAVPLDRFAASSRDR